MNARHSGMWLGLVVFVLLQTAAMWDTSAAAPAATNALISTISASRQFAAYADDRLLPSALCVYAERTKREWLRELDLTDNWRDPILLVVRKREASQTNAPAISLAVFQTDEHLKYQIHCLVPPLINETRLLSALVDTLCSEWANRSQPTVRGEAYATPVMPLWLVEGMATSIQGRYEVPLSVVQRSVAAGRPQQAADLMAVKVLPVDPMEQQLFRANAWIFTEGLMVLPDGARKLQKYLTELGAQKDASRVFWMVYGQDFPRETALEKWWSLELVRHASIGLAQDLSVEETERQLDAILPTKLGAATGRRGVSEGKTVAIDNLWQYADSPWFRNVVELKINRLGTLRSQAHPLYRPVLDKYLEAVTWLHQGSTTHFRRGLRRAEVARVAAEKQAHDIAAYMDQAERVHAPEQLSKVFAGYFQTLDEMEKQDSARHSPISDYLDKFDQ